MTSNPDDSSDEEMKAAAAPSPTATASRKSANKGNDGRKRKVSVEPGDNQMAMAKKNTEPKAPPNAPPNAPHQQQGKTAAKASSKLRLETRPKPSKKPKSCVVQKLTYPTHCKDFDEKIGHIPKWMLLHGTNVQGNKKKVPHVLPEGDEKVAKRSNNDHSLDWVPAPPAWNVDPANRMAKAAEGFTWDLSYHQLSAFVVKESQQCKCCGEVRAPSEMIANNRSLSGHKGYCNVGICCTLGTWDMKITDFVMLAESQVNEDDKLCCVLCAKPFTDDYNSPMSIFKAVKHHDHRVDGNKEFGKTLKQQRKAGLIGLAHDCCNCNKVEKAMDYNLLETAEHLEAMAASCRRHEKNFQERNMIMWQLEAKSKAKGS